MTTEDIQAIGFIGSGHIGGTVARLAVNAGLDVVMSNSRGPDTLEDLVAELGPRATAGTPEDAAKAGDVVVVTVPLKALPDVPAGPLRGKVVLDTGNYYPQRDGRIAQLDDESTTTSELLQAHLPDARMVKVFNNIFFRHLATLGRTDRDQRTSLPIAGDDEDAKAATTALLDRLGFDAYDVGPLAEGWRYQRDTPAYAVLYTVDGDFDRARRVGRDELAEALGAARRYRDM